MKATKLRHRIFLKAFIEARTPTGAVKKEWQTIRRLSAHLIPVSTNTFVQGQALQTNITARCVIRHTEAINETMRVEYSNKLYEIVGILADNNTGKEYLTLVLKGVSNES